MLIGVVWLSFSVCFCVCLWVWFVMLGGNVDVVGLMGDLRVCLLVWFESPGLDGWKERSRMYPGVADERRDSVVRVADVRRDSVVTLILVDSMRLFVG